MPKTGKAATAAAEEAPAGAGELRGRAWAAFLLSFFTLLWTAWGLLGVPTATAVVVICVVGALCLGTAAGGGRLLRRARHRPGQAPPRGTNRRYGAIVGAEFGAIALAAGLLGATGNAEWIPAVVCLAVGVHFLPLARLFGLRLYDVTGWALVLLAALTMIVVPLAGLPAACWRMLPGFGSAAVLWVTVLALLATGRARR